MGPPSQITQHDLRPGDIFLYYHAFWNPIGQIIKWKTGSPYTHASIYLGDGEIAEATPPKIRKSTVQEALKNCRYIAVFRSQCGFYDDRTTKLRDFIDRLIQNNSKYDLPGTWAIRNDKRKTNHQIISTELLVDFFESVSIPKDRTKNTFFCSALVASCYCEVGIIEPSAEVLLKPELYSPIGLSQEPAFGYVFGYLLKDGDTIKANDPFLQDSSFKTIMGCDYV